MCRVSLAPFADPHTQWLWGKSSGLHVQKALLCLFNVVLLEGNTNSEVLITISSSALGNVWVVNGALLVNNVRFGRGHCEASGGQAGNEDGSVGLHGDGSSSETKKEWKRELHEDQFQHDRLSGGKHATIIFTNVHRQWHLRCRKPYAMLQCGRLQDNAH